MIKVKDIASANTSQKKTVLFADVSGSTRLYEVLGECARIRCHQWLPRYFAPPDCCALGAGR